ncbi:SipW-dependent-type signal peptide-containing protein [Yeguia hominis]|uniref:SipW-cognate class signal peptide n=1 Tax=Yeguia hominis TaxID=2763662 RepID=A0A926DBD2_9FIRM|nr:SipW-dependent-type signal peptide-containing protein [Yeguia hominis]MBC8534239.1 hypothetical protein [Yeguia hominis]
MKSSKSTKRALITSALAILMCIAMLIGTTFAWFTDTASTAVNKIQSGNLDVALEMSTDGTTWESAEGKTLTFKTKDNRAADQILWEPGCTYELPQLRVVNKGNLALKYKIQITGIQGDAKLNEVIDWTINDAAINLTEGHLSAGQTGTAFTIKGHMKETAGNDYQNLTIDGIGITVVATQDTVEYDSFGNQYDADAPLDFEPVSTSDELKAAATNGKNVQLTQDVTLTDALTFDKAVTIDLNGKTLTSSLNSNGYSLVTKADATIVNGTYKGTGTARGIGAYGNLTMRNVTVDVAGQVGVACSAADSQYTIEDSTIKGGYALCNFNNNATINVSNSTLEGKNVGFYHNGSNSGLNLTVTGTKINADNNGTDATGVYISGSTATRDAGGYQKASFTDCTVKGNAAIEVKYTNLTLNNCIVTATVDSANASYTQNNNGSTTNGFAVVSTDNATNNTMPKPEGTITINGGSYTGLIGLHNFSEIQTNFPGFVDASYVINP